jgi:hypothetical protein
MYQFELAVENGDIFVAHDANRGDKKRVISSG